jgi:hypothetical protein
MSQVISTLNEKSLHAALKDWYAQSGDQVKVPVDGYIVDIVRGDLLVEVQTGSFSSISDKLAVLSAKHPVRLVYPIAQQKWIVKVGDDGQRLSRRKSPKRGAFEHVFEGLVSFPGLIWRPSFSVDVLLTHEEEIRRHDGSRAWRRKGWVTSERHLLEVVDRRLLSTPADSAALLPTDLPEQFTTADLAERLGRPRRLAQKMAYCLRKMGVIKPTGKQGNAMLYMRAPLE